MGYTSWKAAAEEVVDMRGAGLTQTYFYSLEEVVDIRGTELTQTYFYSLVK